MASAYERRPGRFYARWRDRSGVWQDTPTQARTKREATRLAEELEQRAWRQRMGLEALDAPDGGGTVRELMAWWLETCSAGRSSHVKNTSTIRRHLQAGRIAELRLSELTRGRIEAFLDEKAREGLAPQTVNHLRAYLSRAFSAAIERERWTGANPVRDTKARHGPKRRPDFLRFEEVGPVLAEVPPQHLRLFVTTLYTGLRKGELRALRKVDVDWSLRAIWVRRSGQRDTTKGGHEEPISIHPDLEPVLRAAVDASPSELVFPGSDGKMLRDDFKFAAILRRAMARAGIVEGFLHVCRRKGCHYGEQAADGAARRCPDHGMLLWPKPLVRKITFHHLRHTTASLFLMSGVPLEVVQRMLRHTDPKVTSGVYGHLLMGYQREAIARARLLPPALLGASAAGAQEPAPSVRTRTPLADMLLTDPGSGKKKAGTPVEKPEGVPACELERETGFEPATLSLGIWSGEEDHAKMGAKREVSAGSVPLNPARLGQTLPRPCLGDGSSAPQDKRARVRPWRQDGDPSGAPALMPRGSVCESADRAAGQVGCGGAPWRTVRLLADENRSARARLVPRTSEAGEP